MIASISYTEVSSAPSQCRALPEEEHAPAVAYAGWLDVRYSTGDFDYNKKVCLQWQNDLGGGKKGPTICSLQFRCFNRDHQGNVREVVSEKGEVKQVNAYYPFGTPIHALGTNERQQRYKYNGKEFDELHGLNTYDYGARQYPPLLPQWDRVDPLAEKYYGVSPYAYCLGDPVKNVDVDGEKVRVPKRMDRSIITSYINKVSQGVFAVSSHGNLYLSRDTEEKGHSAYLKQKLIKAINDPNNIITIRISSVAKERDRNGNVVVVNVDKDHAGGVTLSQRYRQNGKTFYEVEIILTGHPYDKIEDTDGNQLEDGPEWIFVHEFAGHAAPKTDAGTDTGNAIDNENKIRKELGKPLRKRSEKHVE